MLLIPAIDLKDGQCVRLRQGDLGDATIFSEDPVGMARHWLELGARRLHVVDLLRRQVAEKPRGRKGLPKLIIDKCRYSTHLSVATRPE